MATSVFINEFHYDNVGTDAGEFIEIAAPAGTDLTGWSLVLYNGANGGAYNTTLLSDTVADQGSGFGTVTVNYPANGIQNGAPDGFALVNNLGQVVQFLSYEGGFTAVGGPADGLTSIDIGVAESGSEPVGLSLQLTGTGSTYEDFTWVAPAAQTPNTINNNQIFNAVTPGVNAFISELHYDNVGTDEGEFVEITANAGADLSGYSVVLYNGNGGAPYNTITLSGVVADQSNGQGTIVIDFPSNGIQNGAPDGVALIDAEGNVVEFLSYEGSFTAVGGAADSLISVDIGVAEDGTTPIGDSLQLINGAWTGPQAATRGIVNGGNNGGGDDGGGDNGGGDNGGDLDLTRIGDIQGAAHISPLVGQRVATTGIVTAVDTNGFYLQDPVGDGNLATSDAIFVFTSSAPGVTVGDELRVEGTVSEFTPGGASTRNLSTTQIGSPTLTTLSIGNPLPAATIIGQGDRLPPTETIDDDAFGSFDPLTDGIDFFESLEGMLVTAQDFRVVDATNNFGEIFGVIDNGVGATGLSDRGTLNISPDDFNPERIQLQFDSGLFDVAFPEVNVGDTLGDVTGVVGYGFGNFEIVVTNDFTNQIVAGGLQPEVSTLTRGSDQLTVATYNVLNLDPNDSDGDTDIADGRFDAIAQQIINNLNAPDIIALQEVQDNTGSANDGVTAADATLQTLVDAIAAAGGPTYAFIDNPFIGNNTSGGQPGSNIRTAYLYDPSRVDLVEGSVTTVGGQGNGEAFQGARLPLIATFEFNGEAVTLVNNHFSSKGGSAPILGTEQPFETRQEDVTVNGSLDERQMQSAAVQNYVNGLLGDDPTANVVVLGDLNEFEFVSPVRDLVTNSGLTNLTETLPEDERYSFIFQGNSQSLDHILVSNGLATGAEFDIVHTNVEFAATPQRASDHDPLLARFTLNGTPNEGDTNTVIVGDGDNIVRLDGRNNVVTTGDGNNFIYIDDAAANGGTNTITTGAGDDNIWLPSGDNTVDAGAGNNLVGIGSGDDTVTAGDGDDFVYSVNGGGGTNTLTLGHGNNTIWLENGDYDIFTGSGNDSIGLGTGTDIVRDAGGDNIIYMVDAAQPAGNKDILTGSGDDYVATGSGDDLIDGGLGLNTLLGGAGNDTFILRAGAYNFIGDFEIGSDALQLTSLSFADLSFYQGTGTVSADAFIFDGEEAIAQIANTTVNQINNVSNFV